MSTTAIEMRNSDASTLEPEISTVLETTKVSPSLSCFAEEAKADLPVMLKQAGLELKQRMFLDKKDEFVPAYKAGVSSWPVAHGVGAIPASQPIDIYPVSQTSQYYKETFDLALRLFHRKITKSKSYSKMSGILAEEQLFKAVIKMIDFGCPDVPKRWCHEMVKGIWAVFELCGEGMKQENEERIAITWRGERRVWIIKMET